MNTQRYPDPYWWMRYTPIAVVAGFVLHALWASHYYGIRDEADQAASLAFLVGIVCLLTYYAASLFCARHRARWEKDRTDDLRLWEETIKGRIKRLPKQTVEASYFPIDGGIQIAPEGPDWVGHIWQDPHWEVVERLGDKKHGEEGVIGYQVRWSEPDEQGRYFWVGHYMMGNNNSLLWCENAAERQAERFNQEKKLPSEFGRGFDR